MCCNDDSTVVVHDIKTKCCRSEWQQILAAYVPNWLLRVFRRQRQTLISLSFQGAWPIVQWLLLKGSQTTSLLPERGKFFLLHIKDTVFYALVCIWGPKRINHIAYSWIMESLLPLKGNLCSKKFCVYNICFCWTCDFICKYCHLGSRNDRDANNQRENNYLSSKFRINQRI